MCWNTIELGRKVGPDIYLQAHVGKRVHGLMKWRANAMPSLCLAAVVLVAVATSDNLCASEPVALQAHDEYIYMISFSRDGKLMATAAGDNRAIVWQVADQKRLHVLEHDAAVYAAAISPDGSVIATGTGERTLSLWSVRTGERMKQLQAHDDAIYCVQYSHDGRHLASAGGSTDGGDTTCRLWDNAMSNSSSYKGHNRQVYGLAFSPDDQLIATGSSDKSIRIWNLENGKHRKLEGHTSDVYRLAFSPDQRQLASVSQDGSVRAWNLATGEATVIHTGTKKNPIYGVAFTHDGESLAAVGDDGRLRIWQSKNWKPQIELRVSKLPLYAIAFPSGQSRVATAGEDGSIYFVDIASASDQ